MTDTAAQSRVLIRRKNLHCLAVVVAGLAFAPPAHADGIKELCAGTASAVAEDMRVREDDLTLEAALRSAETLKRWLPLLSEQEDWEAVMAYNNSMTILNGFRLKAAALNSPDDPQATAAFCQFLSTAFYYD
jgi:hypothetical protein